MSICDIRGAVRSSVLQERSEVEELFGPLTQRSNISASGRPCVALLPSLRPVFVSAPLDYSYFPEDVILRSPRLKLRGAESMRGAEQEAVGEEDVLAGSEISLGRSP